MANDTCPDCGAEPDELHAFGCDVERCPQCGGQLLSCSCFAGCDDEDAIVGRMPWAGEWPGLAECREFGLWCQRNPDGPGWLPCARDVPGATEDLNRLPTACTWDPAARQWVRKDGRRNGSQLPRPRGDRR